MCLRRRSITGQLHLDRPAERCHRLERVLGDVDEHRTRPARRRDVERLRQDTRNIGCVLHQVVVLGDRHRDAADVGFLERVRADGCGWHLTGDRDDRHRVHVGIGDRRHEVGGTRPAGRHTHADPSRCLRVTRRCVAGTLLVSHEDVTHSLRVEQRVVGGQDGTAGDAEDNIGTELFEGADERLRPGEFSHTQFLSMLSRFNTQLVQHSAASTKNPSCRSTEG